MIISVTSLSSVATKLKEVCPICGFTTIGGGMRDHMLCHGRQPPGAYACSECNYSCTKKEGIVRHMPVHGGAHTFSTHRGNGKIDWKTSVPCSKFFGRVNLYSIFLFKSFVAERSRSGSSKYSVNREREKL